MVETRNIFDNEEEFKRLYDAVMGAVEAFCNARGGNVTYGEIIFVLESIVEELGRRCDREGQRPVGSIEEMKRVPQLGGVVSRMLRLLMEKGIISSEERDRIVSG